jgi:hypothetical protein
MEMRYKDFKKIEATYFFMLNVKNGKTKTNHNSDKEKTMQDLGNLKTVKADDLNLPKEYMDIFK